MHSLVVIVNFGCGQRPRCVISVTSVPPCSFAHMFDRTDPPAKKLMKHLFLITILLTSPTYANDVIFSTSFEKHQVGKFTSLTLADGVKAKVQGTASINSRYARTGKQCLHMLGDKGNTLTFQLPAHLQSLQGISFRAERWTRRRPFRFSVEVLQGDKWQKIARLDEVTLVGARFLSHIKLAVKSQTKVKAIRFAVQAAPRSGLLVDDLKFHSLPPRQPTRFPTGKRPTKPLKLITKQDLFVSGKQNTHTFRIPAIITAKNGDLIVACDARRKTSADLGKQRTIDIVFRRSTDNGKTWSPMKEMDTIDHGGCSDPSLLLDRTTGTIFCFYNYMSEDRRNNEYRFIVQQSSDHGKTWSKPIDFTDQVAGPKLKNAFKFVTSGRGIQTREGMLLHNYVRVGRGITLFGSGDHGKSWHKISDVSPGDESKVVQLSDGSLMVNSRIGPGRRHVHRSVDGGKTWKSDADFSLADPRCNACILQYQFKGSSKSPLIFCNAASNRSRRNLAVRVSHDNGATWSEGKVIDRGPSAYSEITILHDGSLGVVYEPGYKAIRFVRFSLDELMR